MKRKRRDSAPDDAGAFRSMRDPEAVSNGEEFVASALGGSSVVEDARDEVVDDETGGPFIVLDDDGSLPSVPDERDPDREGHEPTTREGVIRGARWAARRA